MLLLVTAVWYSIPWQTSLGMIGFHAEFSALTYKPIDGSFLHSVYAAVTKSDAVVEVDVRAATKLDGLFALSVPLDCSTAFTSASMQLAIKVTTTSVASTLHL